MGLATVLDNVGTDRRTMRNPSNQTAIDAVNAFASDLAARFDPTVGCTRSWNTSDPTDFTVRSA